MATFSITSPGVQIWERDISLIAPQNKGTNVFVPGFAAQGPMDEILKITSKPELEQIYGLPTNAAERYFYHSVDQLLKSPANIYTYRIPYGTGTGDGFGSKYSALAYPVRSVSTTNSSNTAASASSTNLNLSAGTYVLGEPVHLELTQAEYISALDGSGFTWNSTASSAGAMTSLATLGGAGVIVLNKAQTTINGQFEGYYVGLIDNIAINPATNFDSIRSIKSVSLSGAATTNYTQVPAGTCQFTLTAAYTSGNTNTISQVMENLTPYDISTRADDDVLGVGVFKLRKSIYATEAHKLDYILEDVVVGSIDSYRKQLNPSGGPALPYFLEAVDNKARNIEVLVNPYISNRYTETSLDVNGAPQKKVRVLTQSLTSNINTLSTAAGFAATSFAGLSAADSLYALGAFSDTRITSKAIGSLPSKLERALEGVRNDEVYDIDAVVEAGLGTVFAFTQAAGVDYYDDTENNALYTAAVDALRTSGELTQAGVDIRANYTTVSNLFENFCNLQTGRGDCNFIADPIRHIAVTGKNSKVLSDRTTNFQTDIYWAMRHQFELTNSSYVAAYANWGQVYDGVIGQQVWIPFSAVAAATWAKSDAAEFPWAAPAGFTRGIVTTLNDIAINPNQKQRDELYKVNLNPVALFPSHGISIFGQKTMSRKPSAFDRINVRRLFQALERPTKKASQFYVFEPNTEFTRTRLHNTLTPLFEKAKNNNGIYDYMLVTDTRINTPEVIDANELRAAVYIKPVRTGEFIGVEFIATRTDANFTELING